MGYLGQQANSVTAAYFQDVDRAFRSIKRTLRHYPLFKSGYVCPFADAQRILMHEVYERRCEAAIDEILDTYLSLPPTHGEKFDPHEERSKINDSDDADSIWSTIIFPEERT